MIFNFSSYELTDGENNVLCKGLNFSIKSGLFEYSEFLLSFELSFYDIKGEDLCNEDMSLIQARLLNTALTLYQNFSSGRDPPESLTSSQLVRRLIAKLTLRKELPQNSSNYNTRVLQTNLLTKVKNQ